MQCGIGLNIVYRSVKVNLQQFNISIITLETLYKNDSLIENMMRRESARLIIRERGSREKGGPEITQHKQHIEETYNEESMRSKWLKKQCT